MKSGYQPGGGGCDNAITKILVTSPSAVVAETTTFSVDLIKTRLQLHGESLSSSQRTNAFRVAAGYENLRSLISGDSGSLSLPSKAVVGGVSGIMAQVIASPADLVKVRMQSDGRLVSQGLQPRYSGPFDALNKIIQSEGYLGLWKGVLPNIQRAFLVNMGELACYDYAKQFVIRNKIADDNVYTHTLASIMSGLCATTLSCPADVVKTRMMNQAANMEGKFLYSSSYDCLVKTVKVEGIRALWKGFFPTWARLGPWQFVFWVSHEKLRKIAGLSSF